MTSTNAELIAPEPIYLTSAIAYANGQPHIGHAYEIIICDIMVRWYQMRKRGQVVRFQTGMDEYGQKIEKTAHEQGITPKDLCDRNAQHFEDLYKDLQINYDRFIRTTDDDHTEVVQDLFRALVKKGDIYLGEYEGLYNFREERFVTEKEASETQYKDPVTGLNYERVKEESYFFRLERYQAQLIDYINSHPEFIADENQRAEVLHRIEEPSLRGTKEPLRDLSISRTSLKWGIPVPETDLKPTKKHYFYVWFDALTNYLTGNCNENLTWGRYGQPIHVIGKDITYFHAVIWSCMLLALEMSLPRQLVIHYHVTDEQGRKMSKSLGNTVDPRELLTKYGSECVRYGIIRLGSSGSDIRFSEKDLRDRHDNELADKYGNLVGRLLAVTKKYSHEKVPDVDVKEELLTATLIADYDNDIQQGHLSMALERTIMEVQKINQWVTDVEPWSKKYQGREPERLEVIRTGLEKIYAITHFLYPFIPETAMKVFKLLGKSMSCIEDLGGKNLVAGSSVNCDKVVLFPKFKALTATSVSSQ